MERHLTDAEIGIIVHRGLPQTVSLVDQALLSHLETCPTCQTRVDEAQRLDVETGHLLQALDVPVPKFDVAKVIGQARRSRRSVRRIVRHAALAASFLVCILGAAAFALPTSALGRLLQHIIRRDHATESQTQRTVAPPPAVPPRVSGIALIPTGPLTIEFRGSVPASLRVSYCDTVFVSVRVALRNAAVDSVPRYEHDRARFSVSNNRIRIITTRDQEQFTLTLPENPPTVYVIRDDSQSPIMLGPPPNGHIAHGCHATITVPLSP